MAFALISCSTPAWAHKASDAYLALSVASTDRTRIQGQWDIALRDLEFALGLDADRDGRISWGELRARRGEVFGYALSRLDLAADGQPCPARDIDLLVDRHGDGAYAVLRFTADCAAPIHRLAIDYRLFFDLDRQHKGLLKLTGLGEAPQGGVFAADDTHRDYAAASARADDLADVFADYLRLGTLHIWIGIDHILFLLALLLPAVVSRRERRWLPAEGFRRPLIEVTKVVTAFTVAHSVTLSAATLGWIALPSRLVESVIALSVVLAAINNLAPRVERRRWLVAFAFGLVHGFGFASVLAELGLPPSALLWSLLAFNLGVETGQLAIVAVFLPLSYALRRTLFYRLVLLTGGSAMIVAVAGLWFVERAFDLKILPF